MIKSKRKINYKNGFGLIEVVVAVSIISSSILFVMFVAQLSQRVIGDGVSRLQAAFLAEEGMEAVKIIRDESWQSGIDSLQAGLNYYLIFNGSAWNATSSPVLVDDVFERTFAVENVGRDANDDIIELGGINDHDTKKIVVSVSWRGRNGTTTESMSTYITNLFSN